MENELKWGIAIALVRTLRSLKQKDLAEQAGIGRAHQSLIEAGKRRMSMKVLGRQCQALGITQVDLARIAEDPEGALGLPSWSSSEERAGRWRHGLRLPEVTICKRCGCELGDRLADFACPEASDDEEDDEHEWVLVECDYAGEPEATAKAEAMTCRD